MIACPTEVEIGGNITFSVTTHTPSTAAVTDADGVPSFRVYEDETATAIASGNMSKLDDGNTTGLYAETLACTSGNGYEHGKTYTVYVEATVGGVTGAASAGFKAYDYRAANTLRIDGDATAATNLAAAATGIVVSTCASGSTASSIVTNLTEATDDHYNGRVITFTTGDLAGQSLSITDYNGTTKTLTVTAVTADAPANTDAFVIT